jgi:predicted enzyme related to lactoylglutathione lyase
MDNPTVWYVNVFVSDFERSLGFYRDQLGLKVVLADPQFGYASFDTQGAGFAIAAVDPDSEQAALVGRHTGIGWGVPDVDAVYETMKGNGVSFAAPPQRQPWGGYLALLEDPDGNVFYLDEFRDA